MLQTRLENEQFNSLPNVFTNNRSRNSFITTDRPDSAQLVDLHIYIIPKSVWKNVQHLAQNEAMDDAISAGFVRVPQDMKLHNLRQSIERLCGLENYFPREFIFLRSVGRCLTRVKPTQENELKVKNYRPPQTFASEIYLLEGRHEDYAHIPSASPALSSANYLFGNHYQHRFNHNDYGRLPSRLSQYNHRKPLRVEKNNLPIINTNHLTSRLSELEKKNWTKFIPIDSDFDESSVNVSVVTSVTSRELSKLREEQERLRRRQAELDRMRRAAEEKKVQSEFEENERQRRQEEKAQSEREENERQRRREEKVQSEREENERQRRREEKAQLERDEEERRRRRRQEKAEAERRRLEQEIAATKIQASYRGFKDRQAFRERQKNIIKNNSRISSSKSNTIIKNKENIDINDDELSYGQILSRSSSIGSTSDVDSNPSRPETRTIKKEDRESIHSNSSSLLSRKIQSNISSYSKNNIDEEYIRTATVTKIRHSKEEFLSVSTPDINNDDDDDTYELSRREAEVKQRRQTELEKRKAKELENQRRRELTNQQQSQDLESLRTRLEELRTNRIDLVKIRDEVIKNLKYIHNRLTLRRKDARDMWKKKYFHEKKKTPSIEERSKQLKTDLDQIHNKTVQTIDNECKHTAQMGYLKEAENGNFILQITRTQCEIEDIRYQIDQAKLRLTTDIKLRNQAENECRTLKQELSQAKMNLNHIKNRVGV